MQFGRYFRKTPVAVLLLLPMCVTAIWAVYLYKTDRMPLTGDEPHYLLIADSIVRDGDLNVRNNYEDDAADLGRERILNLADWTLHQEGHLYENGDALYGKHEAGLAVLLALPYWLYGSVGAKFAMIFLIGLTPFLFFWIARRIVGNTGWALLIALSLSLGLPVSLTSIHIYVDMLAGLLIVLAVECLYRIYKAAPEQPTGQLLVVMALALSALPWLKVAFALPAIICTMAALAVQFRRGVDKTVLKKAAVCATPVVSILLFLVYLKLLFGRFGHPNAHVVEIEWLAVYVFMRLHLDVSRGIMIQQPLLFAGVTGFMILLRREWRFALLLLVLYLSTLGPHAMNVTAHGFAPMGRYAWSSYPLWVFPVCVFFTGLSRRGRLGFGIVCAVLFVLQFLRAWSWAPQPMMTYHPFNLPPAFAPYTDYVPNFYSDLENLPGVIGVWVGLVLLMAVWGFFWKRRAGVVFTFVAPAYVVLALLFLHANESQQRKKVWEAESMQMGTAPVSASCNVADKDASGGEARWCSPETVGGKAFCLVYGPYSKLPAGYMYRVDFYLKTATVGSRHCVSILDVTEGQECTELAREIITEQDFEAPLVYQPFSLVFRASRPLDLVQYRVYWPALAEVWIDRIEVSVVE